MLMQSREDRERLLALLQERARRSRTNAIRRYFPDTGPLRRELYPKHLEFFRAGLHHRERLMCAANRVGKTESVGGYELTLHLTGEYPDWWPGHRFARPIRTWAAGDTSKTVRDIIQYKLLGPYNDIGTGLIPKRALVGRPTPKSGVPESFDTIRVRHVSGGESYLVLKSYDQRRESFQGTEQDVIWLDEEPPQDIYTECVLRTMSTGSFAGGLVMLTFTPLRGVSDVIQELMPGGDIPANQVPV